MAPDMSDLQIKRLADVPITKIKTLVSVDINTFIDASGSLVALGPFLSASDRVRTAEAILAVARSETVKYQNISAVDGETRKSPPAGKFLEISEAAAWIQKHWPQFELDSAPLVQWRGDQQ